MPFKANSKKNDLIEIIKQHTKPNENNMQYDASSNSELSISLIIKALHVHADATYKLILQGYPVLVVGTTDKQKHFHPFGAAISSNENTYSFTFIFQAIKKAAKDLINYEFNPTHLIADAAGAITLGFINTFGSDFTRVMCWFHAIKCIDDHLHLISLNSARIQIREDICNLQLCISEPIFDKAYELFKIKWQKEEAFLEYFDSEWKKKNKGWFEGYAVGLPSTNNALEGSNKYIKKEATLNEIHNIGRFMSILEVEVIKKWSADRDITKQQHVQFYEKPNLKDDLWTCAYLMAIESRQFTHAFIRGNKVIQFIL